MEFRRDFPHHVYSNDQILRNFYDGLVFEYRMALDVASNGDFNTRSVHGAYTLLENIEESSHKKSTEFDGTVRAPASTSVPIPNEALVTQIEKLLKRYNAQREVHLVAEGSGYQQETDGNAEISEEVNYVNCQGYGQNCSYNQNSRNNPLFFWRNNNVFNPQNRHYPVQQPNKQFPSNQRYRNQQQQGNSSNLRWNNSYPQENQGKNTHGHQQKLYNQAPVQQPHTAADQAIYGEFNAMIIMGNEVVQSSLKDLNEHIAANAENSARFATFKTRIRNVGDTSSSNR